MGLDQFAYVRGHDDDNDAYPFVWRKHAKLQQWAQDLFEAKPTNAGVNFNCVELVLTHDNINDLRARVLSNELPNTEGGFFWGHQHQDEAAADNREQDLAFCDWATEAISDGETVVYKPWW